MADEVYLAVRPMLATSDGALWLMSTPNGKRGFFYDTWENGGPAWMRIRAPATECARIDPHFLQEERRTRDERTFGQEYLCEFGEAERGVFGRDLLQQALTKEIAPLDLG